ncbi:MAG: ThiF family adenylyltransferase [Acidobacteriota bacterium]|nr:ThiF family adenylyltransferase [Acidobacteriota bacterium]
MLPGNLARYSRQIRFEGWGEKGQERLLASHAIIVGCGALGALQAEALSRAGVGRLTIIDRDFVEETNLQRQFLFSERDASEALPKAIAARRRIAEINSSIEVRAIVADLEPGNANDLLHGADIILDGTDNFETRYLVNDFAVSSTVPWIYGAAVGSYGLIMPVLPGETACLRCVYPDPPTGAQPTCETAGVLNSLTMLIAALQVAEAFKILSGNRDKVRRKITTADVWSAGMREVEQPARDSDCPACGRREFSWLDGAHRAPVSLCGRNAVQIHERTRPMDLEALRSRLARLGEVRANEFALRFFVESYELTIFPDGRAIVRGTTDVGTARSLYARYIG